MAEKRETSHESARAFRVLQAMVTSWYEAAANEGNQFADTMLVHLYRWLCSPKSLFHDPELHAYVSTLMKKIFYFLINELHEMGASIISGNFQRVIICTNRKDEDSAVAYIDHLISSLKKVELFRIIHKGM